MNPDDIAKILDDLGQRLGPTGERVFALAVRQVYIEAVIGIVAAIVAVALSLALLGPVYRWVQAGDSYSSRDLVGALAGVVCLTVLGFLLAYVLFWALPALLNPEYAALEKLLGAIR